MEYTINYGSLQASVPIKAGPAKSEPLWAAIDGRVSALSGDEVVFHDPITRRSHVMTHQVLQALELCRPFRTLQEHCEAVAESLPGLKGKAAAVRPVLESLTTRGLLMNDDAFLMRLSRSSGAQEVAPVAGLFVLTADRPDALADLLRGLKAQAGTLTVCERLVIVDDSRQQDSVAANAATLAEFAADWTLPLHHVTPALALGWVCELQAELAASAEDDAYALTAMLTPDAGGPARPGRGRSHNLLTLLSAGGRYLVLSDEQRLPLRRAPQAELALDTSGGQAQVRTFDDASQALADGESDAEALALHLALCGQRLADLLGEDGALRFGRAELAGTEPSRQPWLSADTRVAATVTGTRGSAISASAGWMLTLDAPARSALCASDADYLARRADPAMSIAASNVGLNRVAPMPAFAVDNSSLTGCALPSAGGVNLTFNALIALGHPQSAQLVVPHSTIHQPATARDYAAQFGQPKPVSLDAYLADLTHQVAADSSAADADQRYRLLAARIDDQCRADDATLLGLLGEFLVYERVMLVRALQESAVAAAGAPMPYQIDIKTHLEANAKAVMERGVPRLSDWPADLSPADCAARFRQEAGAFAAALRVWPQAWQLATTRNQGWLQRALVVR